MKNEFIISINNIIIRIVSPSGKYYLGDIFYINGIATEVLKIEAGNILTLLKLEEGEINLNSKIIYSGGPMKININQINKRVVDGLCNFIDGNEELKEKDKKYIKQNRYPNVSLINQSTDYNLVETGIKIIDVFTPYIKGAKIGILGGAGVGKTVLMLELINCLKKSLKDLYTIFCGIGERVREGKEFYDDILESKIENISLIYGNMNEPAGMRVSALKTGLSIAEYQRDIKKNNVLIFIDNVFRYLQANNEISAGKKNIPGEAGYQPTLNSEVSEIQERITNTLESSVTSIQAVYVTADDYLDPSVTLLREHFDSVLVLDREMVINQRYPAVNILSSSCNLLTRENVGDFHYNIVQKILNYYSRYQELKKMIAIMGIDSLSTENKIIVRKVQRIESYLTQPTETSSKYTNIPGVRVPLKQTLQDLDNILQGKYDSFHPQELYMKGSIKDLI